MLFKSDLAFLSNFYAASIEWEGKIWPTVEHAFQASKTVQTANKEAIRKALFPGVAKKMGKRLILRGDWEEVKLNIMRDLVRLKFTQHLDLRDKLLATEDLKLIEGNYWHDNFWGNCYCDNCSNIVGENMLGSILMELRETLKKEKEIEKD